MRYLLIALLLVASANAAPAPLPRSVRGGDQSLAGVWVLASQYSKWTMHLSPGGSYYAFNETSTWVGLWTYENDVITIREKMADSPPQAPLHSTMVMTIRREGRHFKGEGPMYTMKRIVEK